EDRPGLRVERAELAIEVADEREAARGREYGREKRRALLVAPDLFHRRGVVRRELADVALGPRHFKEAAIGVGAARAFTQLDLPENAGLADGEDVLLRADIHEHALVDFVEIERLARNVLEVPRELSIVDIDRDSRRRVQGGVEDRSAAAGRHPGLGLSHAPVR